MGWISSNIISDLGGAIESYFDPHVSDLGGVVHTPGQPSDDDTRSGSQQATVDHHIGMRAPTMGERIENWWTQPAHKYAGVLGIPEESPQQKTHDVEKAAMVGGLAVGIPTAPVETAVAALGGTVVGYAGGKLGHFGGKLVGAPELGQDIGEVAGGIVGGETGAEIGGEAAGAARSMIHERAATARANMAARANANTIDLTPDQYRWVPNKAKGGFKALSPSGATLDLKTAPPPATKVDVSAEGPSWERQLAARKNGTVVGGVGYKIDPQGKAQIYGSVVTPELRGKGIGQQMYENAAYDAKAQGATKLVSDATNTSPDAIRVWQKMQAKGWPITPITHPNGKPGFEMDLSQVHFKANPEPAPITFGEDSLGRYATSSDSPAKVYIPKNLEGDDALKYAKEKLDLQRNFAANRAAKPAVRNPGVSEVARGATEYNAAQNRPPVVAANEHANPEFGARTADAYEAMRHEPENPKVQRSYNALKTDIQNQWNFATQNMGIKFEPWTGEGQPYRDSGDMERDVRENHHLYFYRGGEMPGDHPLADVDPQTGLRYNDMLRAVHDLFGHAAHGNQFGPTGERNAYLDHAQMFSHEALPALTSETHGQNSWVNFGSHLRNAEGIVPKKGEAGYISPTERPFAQQKAGLLPKRFQSPATYHPDLQAIADKYGVTNRADKALNAGASFITPDGKYIPLNGTTHPEAIEKLTGERTEEDKEALGEKMSGNTNPKSDSRVRFLDETGAIRVRASNNRAGKTLHISIPPDGLTEEQIDALKRLVAQQGRYGNLGIERSDITPETKDQLSQYEEFATPSKVDDLLRKIGAHPEGAIEPQSTDLKNVPLLQIPSEYLGEGMGTTESTVGHEYGHVLEGALRDVGEPSTAVGESGIMSHNHPRLEAYNAVGGVNLGFSQKALQDAFGVPRHTFLNTPASNGMPYYRNILDRFIAGGMVEQEYYGIPWEKNNGTSDDIKKAVDVLTAAGIDDPKQMRDEIAASQERIKHDLTIPGMRDIFMQYAQSREEGLAPEYHASLERLQDFIAKVKQHYEIQKGPQTLASRGRLSQTGTTTLTGETPSGERRGASGLANRGETSTAGEGEQGKGTTENQLELDLKKKSDWADKAVNLTNESSAGAIDPNTGKVDKTGFGVEVYPEARAGSKPLDHPPTAQDFQKFYEDNKEIFEKHPELRVGWDKTDKGWELNIGASGTEAGARLVGRNLDQRAAYDIENQKELPTGGKGEKTKFVGYSLEERLADLTGESVKKLPAEISKSPHLTDDEKYLLASEPSALKDFKETRKKIAPTEEIAAIALMGTANRHWYARARSSFNAMFDSLPQDFHTESDREKFPTLVAATSPQSDPSLNLRNALDAYKKWVDAGRPSDVNEVRKIVDPVLELGAHQANAARAVTGQELSGPKVSSFSKNFAGQAENVTNDMWGAITNGIVDSKELSKPGKYIALSENYRKAADWLNKNGKKDEFGKAWTPEETQAASWGFIRTLGYASGWKGTGSWKPPALVVHLVDDPLVRKFSADIADIMLTDDEIRDRLESLGVNLEDFDAQLEQGLKQFGRGKAEGKTEGVDVKHLTSAANRVERAKQYAVTQAKTGARVAGKMQPLVNQILSGDFELTPNFKLKRKK